MKEENPERASIWCNGIQVIPDDHLAKNERVFITWANEAIDITKSYYLDGDPVGYDDFSYKKIAESVTPPVPKPILKTHCYICDKEIKAVYQFWPFGGDKCEIFICCHKAEQKIELTVEQINKSNETGIFYAFMQ